MDITLKINGESKTLTISRDATVKNLKHLIHKTFGLKFSEQRLFYDNRNVDNDNHLLESYDITDNSVVVVIPIFSDVKAYVVLPSKDQLIFTIQSSDKVSKLKSLVQESCGLLPEEQMILHNGQEIAHDTILADKEIRGVAQFQVILRKITNDKNVILRGRHNELWYSVKVEKETSVSELKRKVSTETGCDITNASIGYKNRILKDNDKLEDVGIRDAFSSLSIMEIEKVKFTISIVLPDGKTSDLSVIPNEQISQLKVKIQDLSRLSMEDPVILYKGEALDDRKILSNYHITNGAILKMIPRQKGPIQIIVKAADNKTFSIKVFKMEKCRDLKEKIQEKFAMHPDEQSLTFHDVILEDDKFLNDYQLADKSVVSIFQRLRGGQKRRRE